MNWKPIIGKLVGLTVLVLLAYFGPELPYFKGASNRYSKMYDAFYKAEVREVLVKIEYANHAVLFKLKDGRSFVCTAYCDKNNLVNIGDKGDSLLKHKDDEYFVLKKQNGEKCRFEMIDRRKPYDPY